MYVRIVAEHDRYGSDRGATGTITLWIDMEAHSKLLAKSYRIDTLYVVRL